MGMFARFAEAVEALSLNWPLSVYTVSLAFLSFSSSDSELVISSIAYAFTLGTGFFVYIF
jgi:hypothetical protein